MVKQTTYDSSADSHSDEASTKSIDPSHELVPLYLSGNNEPDPSEFTNQLRKRGRSLSSRILAGVLLASAIAMMFALFSSDNMRRIVADAEVSIGFKRPAPSGSPQPDSLKLTAEQIELLRDPTRLSKPAAATPPHEETPPANQSETQSQAPTSMAPAAPATKELSNSEKDALFKQFLVWEIERKARAQISSRKAKHRKPTAAGLSPSAGSRSTR